MANAASGSIKVAVVMGGPSGEHEISLRSGQGVVEALRQRQWPAEPLRIPKTLTVEDACAFTRRALQRMGAEVAFIALHGVFGEDGTIQQLCEDLHVAYTGSDASASRLGLDKVASRKRFAEAGLTVPRWEVSEPSRHRGHPERFPFPYPVVVKPIRQGSSLGVSLVPREAELHAALMTAAQYDPQVVIEEYIPGRELTVGIFGEEPLSVVEIRPTHPFFDYRAKYTAGLTDYVAPAPLSAALTSAVQSAGLAAHRSLGCRHVSRADVILTRDHVPVLLEVNTIPGLTPTSLLPKAAACRQISYEELCERMVVMAIQERVPHEPSVWSPGEPATSRHSPAPSPAL